MEVPLQCVVERDALTNQPLAVIDQQPQVELGSFQLRGRQLVEPLAQRRPRHSERVDAVRFAALAATAPHLGHQPRRDPQNTLSALDQEPLKRPRDVAAVLERPDAVAVQPARPTQQHTKPAVTDLDSSLAEQLACHRANRSDRVRALVHVRTEHDHGLRPFRLN
jgi:hypothetical protein